MKSAARLPGRRQCSDQAGVGRSPRRDDQKRYSNAAVVVVNLKSSPKISGFW